MPPISARFLLLCSLLFGLVCRSASEGSPATSIYREVFSARGDSPELPSGQRVPVGWPAFAVGTAPVTLRNYDSREPPPPGSHWLRLTTALDDREPRIIEVTVGGQGRKLGQLDLRFAHALEIFQLSLTPEQASEVRREGVTLRLLGPGSPVWFFHHAPADTHLPVEYQPHLLTALPSADPIAEFPQRLASLASLQPFGWMEGCVLEALRVLADQSTTGPYRAAREAHWRVFLPSGNRLVYENPRSEPREQRLHSIEDGLPFADLAYRQPASPVVDLFVDYCVKLRRADGAIQGGNMLSAEGSYTLAYPLAVIAALRQRPDLAALSQEQLAVRRSRLWHEGALWLRHYDDGHRTFRGWARGVAWHLLGTIQAITPLRGHGATDLLEADLRRAAAWLLPLQRPDGLWSCFVEDVSSPPDTSGSAGIAAALAHGARLGILPPAAQAASRRTLATLYRQLTPDGFLTGAAQSNRGGEELQRSDYRVLSQMGMGLLGQLVAECGDLPSPRP